MKLLVVNDDGISSSFLHLLVQLAQETGHQVTVCAPAAQQSAASQHYHTRDAVRVKVAHVPGAEAAYAVEGTPADCVRIALRKFCPDAQAVISGVNLGYNTGWPVYASGTVGAAREALFTGVPALALSAEPRTPRETLTRFIYYALRLAQRLQGTDEAVAGVWNLNAPCVEAHQVLPMRLCPLNPAIYRDDYDRTDEADGAMSFRLRGLAQVPPLPGTDLALLEAGHMTCTVLHPESGDQARYAALLQEE